MTLSEYKDKIQRNGLNKWWFKIEPISEKTLDNSFSDYYEKQKQKHTNYKIFPF